MASISLRGARGASRALRAACRQPPPRASGLPRTTSLLPPSRTAACFHTGTPRGLLRRAHNREEIPEGPPTTDFNRMDVLGATPVPSTSIDACLPDGFQLNSGVRIDGGAGALLLAGEAFSWRPWEALAEKRLLNAKGQWEVPEEALGLLSLVWPKPDLLLLGLGPQIRPLSPATRQLFAGMGMRIEVLDTRNAASQFNLLATERGVDNVGAALIPLGWKEGIGAV